MLGKQEKDGESMSAKIFNLAEKRKEKEKEIIIRKINEYYQKLREEGFIIHAPKRDE
jgi:hypothetical protein